MKGIALLQGEKIAKEEKYFEILKNLLLQNQKANFNETWYKSSLGTGDSKLLK
jgi:hypothetical protein